MNQERNALLGDNGTSTARGGEELISRRRVTQVIVPGLFLLTSCAPRFQSSLPSERPMIEAPDTHLRKIRHIVMIVQEGRTFENIFAGWPGANAPLTGVTHTGRVVKLQETSYAGSRAINDKFQNAKIAWHGGEMNDFDLNSFRDNMHKTVGLFPYAYLNHKETAPYRAMASQYVLSDRMFPTEFGGSFTSHQDLIAGSTFVTASAARAGCPT
jgi:phospholipase C